MNILGLVFSASLFQQTDQQQSLESNDLRAKCSAVADISRPLENKTIEASLGIKSQKDPVQVGFSKKSSDDLDELSRHSFDVNRSSGIVSTSSNVDEPVKRTFKRKKKKKGKSNKIRLDNDITLQTVDAAILTFPSAQRSSKNISLRTGLTECVQYNAMVCNQSSKEVIDKSYHDLVVDRSNSTCSESTHKKGLKHFLNTGDTECYASISKLNSAIVVLQDLDSVYNKVDETCNTKFARNNDKNTEAVPGSAGITSVTGWEPIGVFLEDIRVCKTKSSTNSSCHDNSNLIGSHIAPMDSNHKNTETCEEGSNRVGYGMERSNVIQNEVIEDCNDCITEWNVEAPCSRSSSVNSMAHCTGSLQISLGGKESDKDDSSEEVKSINQCSGVSDVPAVAPIQNAEHDEGHSQILNNTLQMPSHMNNSKKLGKENSHFIRQRTERSVGSLQTHGRKYSDHDHLWTGAASPYTTSLLKHNYKGDGLLFAPQFPYSSKDFLQQGVKNLGISDQKMYRTHGRILAEAPEWAAQESSHTRIGQYVLRSREDDVVGNKTWEKSKHKLHQPFKQENANHWRKGFWVNKASLCKPGTSSNLIHREASEIPRTAYLRRSSFVGQRSSHCNDNHRSDFSEALEFECIPSFSVRSSHVRQHGLWTRTSGQQKLFHEIQPHYGTETTTIEDVMAEAFHVPLADEVKSSACFEIDIPYGNNMKESFTSRVSSQKWIPVGKKDSSMLKTSIDVDSSNIRKVELHQETGSVPICRATTVVDIIKDVQKYKGPSNGGKGNCLGEGKCDYYSACDWKSKSLPIYIGSELAVQALDSSYKLQIASESVQLATGCPIAEFEKLLYSASPVIIPSFFQPHCDYVTTDKPNTTFISKFQKPDVLLRDVWNWFERPGNYGLEVKAEEFRSSKGLETNVSFHAHFVPFLSAIQLFGHSCHSLVGSSPGNASTSMLEKGETEQCSRTSSSLDLSFPELVAQPVAPDFVSSPCNIAPSDKNGCSNLASSLCSSDDSQVIFEYFEHEPPQQRKPLLAKVKELLEVGTSNPQVFGDPSKLECMNLQDLNPASWYSVAWYPIYRIPEGCFRASFLTYHSLGHLVLRRNKSVSVEDNAFCVVSPVLGMQSYNAQGECWFHPKKPAESFLKDGKPFDVNELLKERLRTLEETAALFARGHVRKDHMAAPNRQPDYEFFLSRKQ